MTSIAVCCGKGSPGATFTSVNLAAALARAPTDVALIDLDLSGGDVGAYLALDPRKGLHMLSRLSGPYPEHDQLASEIQEVFGIKVIGGLPRPVTDEVMSPVPVKDVSAGIAEFVIFDLGRLPGPSLPVASMVDLVLVVVRPDVVSVSGAERCLASIEELRMDMGKLKLVVTAHRRRHLAALAEIGDALGIEVAGVIPWAAASARRALLSQKPIATGSLARAFSRLGSAVTATQGGAAPVLRQVASVA